MAYPNAIAGLVSGLFGSKLRPQPTIEERVLIRQTLTLLKVAADGAAGNATAYTAAPQIRMPRACKVLGVYVHPQAALTADNANNALVKVVKGDGAAGAEVVCASMTTNVASGNWVAGTTKALTLSGTVANLRIPAGGVLSFSIAKNGTGVVVPISAFTVDVEWEDADTYTTAT
jgi:hypothetical protein